MASLRVSIDARLTDGLSGGVQQVVIGLASGLANLKDGDEEYLFLTLAGSDEWLRPYISGPCRVLPGSRTPRLSAWTRPLLRRAPFVRRAWQALRAATAGHISLPASDGTIEAAGVEVMHFATQGGFLTEVPTIYQPHDLQHLHFPQFFSPWERAARETVYRAYCEQARLVCMMTAWGKDDLIDRYGLPESKVVVVAGAPVLTAYPKPAPEEIRAVRVRHGLASDYVYYPAHAWPHKNHLALLEALAILRDREGLIVPFVSSGGLDERSWPNIRRRIRELRLEEQVQFLGYVPAGEMRSLYALAHAMVFPSVFEGWGMPILEAFLAGAPVACSNVTCLPALVGDAALLFDPSRPEEIANAIHRLWTDPGLREVLISRGRERVAPFSWDRTGRIFRAHYRRIAGRPLTAEDAELLASPPLV